VVDRGGNVNFLTNDAYSVSEAVALNNCLVDIGKIDE
jgi:hypothetical protein